MLTCSKVNRRISSVSTLLFSALTFHPGSCESAESEADAPNRRLEHAPMEDLLRSLDERSLHGLDTGDGALSSSKDQQQHSNNNKQLYCSNLFREPTFHYPSTNLNCCFILYNQGIRSLSSLDNDKPKMHQSSS